MGQKRIAIYVGTFYTAQMDSANLGGSEVAALNLATELIKLGNSVIIYGALSTRSTTVNSIECRNWERMFYDDDKFDVLIISRFVYALDLYHKNLNRFTKIIYWMHDAHFHDMGVQVNSDGSIHSTKLPNFGIDMMMKHINKIDKIACVSNWQRNIQVDSFKVPQTLIDKIVVIHNAVPDKLFDMDIGNKRKHSFIYTTDPTRAMDPIMKIWPKILEKWPDATMDVFFYGKVEDKLISSMKSTHGFMWHGGVKPDEIYQHIARSEVYFNPSLSHETFGLSTVQASALGCKVLSRGYSGLAETGMLIGSTIYPDVNGNMMIDDSKILSDLDKPVDLMERIRTYEHFSWHNIINEWTNLL